MSTFRIGQKVVCTSREGATWKTDSGEINPGPKRNDIVSINGFEPTNGYLMFKEYGNKLAYCPNKFKPLVEDDMTSYGINDLIEMIPVHEYQTL